MAGALKPESADVFRKKKKKKSPAAPLSQGSGGDMCLQLPKSILHLQSRGENTDRSMAQFSSNWRVPGCLVEQEERILPDFRLAAEMLWAVSCPGANSYLHQAPLFPSALSLGLRPWSPSPAFCTRGPQCPSGLLCPGESKSRSP